MDGLIAPDELAIQWSLTFWSPSLSFMGKVGKKQITNLGYEKYC